MCLVFCHCRVLLTRYSARLAKREDEMALEEEKRHEEEKRRRKREREMRERQGM